MLVDRQGAVAIPKGVEHVGKQGRWRRRQIRRDAGEIAGETWK